MKILFILLIMISGCASTQKTNQNYNSIENYEIVFVDNKMTKTSKLALKQINSNEEFSNINIELFRNHKEDLKSIIYANMKKKDIQNILNEKKLNFKYNPTQDNKNAILKVE